MNERLATFVVTDKSHQFFSCADDVNWLGIFRQDAHCKRQRRLTNQFAMFDQIYRATRFQRSDALFKVVKSGVSIVHWFPIEFRRRSLPTVTATVIRRTRFSPHDKGAADHRLTPPTFSWRPRGRELSSGLTFETGIST